MGWASLTFLAVYTHITTSYFRPLDCLPCHGSSDHTDDDDDNPPLPAPGCGQLSCTDAECGTWGYRLHGHAWIDLGIAVESLREAMIGLVGNDVVGRPPLLGLGSAPGIGLSNHNTQCVESSLGHEPPVLSSFSAY